MMSALRTLKRSIREQETGERGQGKSRAWSKELGAKDKRKQQARRRNEIARESRKGKR